MPFSQEDILNVCEILAEQEQLRVTVNESFKGASITFVSAFVGALVAGPFGLFVGAVVGSGVAAVKSKGKFKSVVYVIMYEMPQREKQKLVEAVDKIVRNVDASDVITLITMLQGNAALKMAILEVIKGVVTTDMGLKLV